MTHVDRHTKPSDGVRWRASVLPYFCRRSRGFGLEEAPLAQLGSAPPVGGDLGCVSHTNNHPQGGIEMNSINISGRLTTDPELRSLPSGDAVCKLRLAVEGLAPGRETGYVNVTCFGKGGEAAARVLAKGWLVAVEGRLEYHEWETDEGSKRHDYQVVGNVEFLAAPRGNGSETPEPQEASAA
jgi:single-strand DNA-binding protein